MTKYLQILFFIVLTWVCTDAYTQNPVTKKPETLQQQKMAFFNDKLQLSPAESAKFWPIYNDYQNRRDKITRDRNTLMQYFESNQANMNEKEASELIQKYIVFQKQETELLDSYTSKFREFLPAKKVMQIYQVELDFKKWLLENLRQNKVIVGSPKN
jgi:hypothetical protein